MEGSSGAADDDREDERPSGGGFRWRCPACGASRVNTMSRRGRNALRALKTHVYLTDGNGHGENASYPDAFPEEDLPAFVEPASGSDA